MNKPSILEYDITAGAEAGARLKMLNPDGTETALTLFVLGDDCDVVQTHINAVIRADNAIAAAAKKAGKEVEFDLAKVNEKNVCSAAARVTGWEGVDEEFDVELLKRALRRNGHWVEQIIAYAGNRANFIKSPSKN